MSWIINVAVIGICGAGILWERRRNNGTVWIHAGNYQYIVAILLLTGYGVWAILLGDENSFFRGIHLGNTMTALALGILMTAKMMVDVKRELDRLAIGIAEDDEPGGRVEAEKDAAVEKDAVMEKDAAVEAGEVSLEMGIGMNMEVEEKMDEGKTGRRLADEGNQTNS